MKSVARNVYQRKNQFTFEDIASFNSGITAVFIDPSIYESALTSVEVDLPNTALVYDVEDDKMKSRESTFKVNIDEYAMTPVYIFIKEKIETLSDIYQDTLLCEILDAADNVFSIFKVPEKTYITLLKQRAFAE